MNIQTFLVIDAAATVVVAFFVVRALRRVGQE